MKVLIKRFCPVLCDDRRLSVVRGMKLILPVMLLCSLQPAQSQGRSFLNNFRVGFGGGVNFAQVMESGTNRLYEDVTGTEYQNTYSGPLQNFGHQYFFHIDWKSDFLVIALKPGTYTFNFTRLSNIIFQDETTEQENPIQLRYFEVPLEVKYNYDFGTFQPYVGAGASYGHRLGAADAVNGTFIRPKVSVSGMGGTYIDLSYLVLDINIGYHFTPHLITSKANRYDTQSPDSFAQGDVRLNDLRINISALFSLQQNKKKGSLPCNYQ